MNSDYDGSATSEKKSFLQKYKCKEFEDIIGNSVEVQRISDLCSSRKRTHLIILGPSGVGKRSLVKIFIEKTLGSSQEDALLYFSCSADTSIQNVRDTVTNFVTKKIVSTREPRMIVFEDADNVSEGVQQLLRSVIGKYPNASVLCIFIGQKIDSIIESLQTRCLTFSLQKVSTAELVEFLNCVSLKESIEISQEALRLLAEKVHGDVRQAVNYLEFLSKDFIRGNTKIKSSEGGNCAGILGETVKQISVDTVQNLCMFPCYESIETMVESINQGENIVEVMRIARRLLDEGFSGLDLLGFLQQYICLKGDEERDKCTAFINELAVTTLRMKEGVNSYLQVFGMLARLGLNNVSHK